MEDKGNGDKVILKLQEVRNLRKKTGRQYKNKIDLDCEDEDVLDSNILIGAQRIEKFLIQRKKRREKLLKLRQRRSWWVTKEEKEKIVIPNKNDDFPTPGSASRKSVSLEKSMSDSEHSRSRQVIKIEISRPGTD